LVKKTLGVERLIGKLRMKDQFFGFEEKKMVGLGGRADGHG
jgi:hypothetical protein